MINDLSAQVLPLRIAAAVLGLSHTYLRGQADQGKLMTVKMGTRSLRFVPIVEIERIAEALGIEPNWSAVPEFLD